MHFLFIPPSFFILVGGGATGCVSTESLVAQSSRAAMLAAEDTDRLPRLAEMPLPGDSALQPAA